MSEAPPVVPASLPPAPRLAICNAKLRIWAPRVLFLLIAVLSSYGLLAQIFFSLFAAETSGQVTGGQCQLVKGRQACSIEYRYVSGERALHGEARVSEQDYARLAFNPALERQATVQVLHSELGSHTNSRLAGSSVLPQLLFPLFSMIWAGFFVFNFWILPWRERRLCELGMVAAGRIVGVRIRGGRSRARLISFEFLDSSGTTRVREMRTPHMKLPPAAVGDAVTVLFDPDDPSKSLAYEFSSYRAEPLPAQL